MVEGLAGEGRDVCVWNGGGKAGILVAVKETWWEWGGGDGGV